MTPLAWIVLADTAVTVAALVFAVFAWRRVGGYMRQCRLVVQAYGPLTERVGARLDDTQPSIPPIILADTGPTGRHARVGASSVGLTDVAPAVGDLDDTVDGELRVPPYYDAHETLTETVPRYYFDELQARERVAIAMSGGER